MKIGFFTDSYSPRLDGVAVSVETCAQALRKRGHEVYIIAPRHPRHKDKDKYVHRLASIKFPTVPGTPEARMVLHLPEKPLLNVLKIDFDIIHGHSTLSGITFLGLEIAKSKNIPYITTYHTLWNKYTHYIFNGKIVTPKMIEIASKFVGNIYDYTIAPTERVKKELISYGIKKPIAVLPTGVDLRNFENIKKGYLRKITKIPKDTKIVLSCGRLGREKALDFIIKAFKLINEKNSNTALVLIGEGPDMQKLKKLAKKMRIQHAVYFLGKIDHKDIPLAYADADVFVFASQTETQGLVVVEAFASGLPVVAVNDDALLGVIKDGKNGYLVEKDTILFAEKALKLLAGGAIYNRFSNNAKASVKKFSDDKIAKSLELLYDKLIIEKGDKQNWTNFNKESVGNFFSKVNTQIKNILYI